MYTSPNRREPAGNNRTGAVMSETKRTILLFILLIIAVGFIYWTRYNYSVNFTDSL